MELDPSELEQWEYLYAANRERRFRKIRVNEPTMLDRLLKGLSLGDENTMVFQSDFIDDVRVRHNEILLEESRPRIYQKKRERNPHLLCGQCLLVEDQEFRDEYLPDRLCTAKGDKSYDKVSVTETKQVKGILDHFALCATTTNVFWLEKTYTANQAETAYSNVKEIKLNDNNNPQLYTESKESYTFEKVEKRTAITERCLILAEQKYRNGNDETPTPGTIDTAQIVEMPDGYFSIKDVHSADRKRHFKLISFKKLTNVEDWLKFSGITADTNWKVFKATYDDREACLAIDMTTKEVVEKEQFQLKSPERDAVYLMSIDPKLTIITGYMTIMVERNANVPAHKDAIPDKQPPADEDSRAHKDAIPDKQPPADEDSRGQEDCVFNESGKFKRLLSKQVSKEDDVRVVPGIGNVFAERLKAKEIRQVKDLIEKFKELIWNEKSMYDYLKETCKVRDNHRHWIAYTINSLQQFRRLYDYN